MNYKVEQLLKGETIISKEPGNSMTPILESRQPVEITPCTWDKVEVGDIGKEKELVDRQNIIHIISRGNKWAIYRPKDKRAVRVFKHREEAYYHARQLSDNIIVHDIDGSVCFVTGDCPYIIRLAKLK